MGTIATAKVQINYNCYNVYFYECLRIFYHQFSWHAYVWVGYRF